MGESDLKQMGGRIVLSRSPKDESWRNERGVNGLLGRNGIVDIRELRKSKLGRVDTLDEETNQVIILKPHGFVVEFLGIPKGGKSYQIENLVRRLKEDEEFSELEIELFKPNTEAKMLFAKQPPGQFHEDIVLSQKKTLGRLYGDPKNESVLSREIPIAAFDRCVIDSLPWTEYRFRRKEISQDYKNAFITMLQISETKVNLAIGVNVNPEEAYQRALEKEGEGNIMNPRSLQQLYTYFMILDYLNDDERKNIMEADSFYRGILTELESRETKEPGYYDFLRLNIPYLGIECGRNLLGDEKEKDKQRNNDKAYERVCGALRARLQEYIIEA